MMTMKTQISRELVWSLLGGLGLLILSAGFVSASDGTASTDAAARTARQVSVTLNAGETYVIKGLSQGDTPAVRVRENPNALVVRSEVPGQLALRAASAGEWAIDVKNDAGENVTYKVAVKAPANPRAIATTEMSSAAEPSATAGFVGSGLPSTPGSRPEPSSGTAIAAGSSTSRGSADPAPGTPLPAVPAASAPEVPAVAPVSSAVADSSSAASPAGSSSSSAPSGSASSGPAPTSASASSAPEANAPANVMASQSLAPAPENFKTNPMARVEQPYPHTGGTNYLPEDAIDLAAGSSEIYDFARRIRRISIADTGVADVQVINPYEINLIAHSQGFTTIAVWDTQGHYEERQIRVDPYGKQQVLLNVIVAEINRSAIEQQGVNVSLALQRWNLSLVDVLSGGPATPFSGGSGGGSSGAGGNNLPTPGTILPLILSPTMTYGLAANNRNINTQTLFEFLEQHNLGKVLAEPRLLANSGEKAEFLDGGEIPIVVAQALNTSIVFKQFGASVIFVPTVVGKDDIELNVKPEVSEPSVGLGVNLFGFTVPGFVTRRAATDVRMKNNQTLIIAGLLLDTKNSDVSKTPYLGDIPVVGRLFKNTHYNHQQTDLVMSVTPQIVSPLPYNGQVSLPSSAPEMTSESVRTRRVYPPDVTRPRF
jgi:Flp pilus assembly secretin CpaC